MMSESGKKNFFLGGVCGMGMAPLAAFLREDGNAVSGFDDCPNDGVKLDLESRGVAFTDTPEKVDEIVISTALMRHRAEIEKRFPGKTIMRRGECWAKICADRRLVAVVGSHGKSTVSAMLAHAASKSGERCGWLVGAIPRGFPMHRHCGKGEIIISEIDESDGTIENFSPEITVALNADLDHTDTYADDNRLGEMFGRLFARTKKLIIYPESDRVLARIAGESKTPSLAVKTPGDFISKNRAMARAALEKTFSKEFSENIFDDFRGLLRRQEIFCDTGGVAVVADYAHHPHEVESFLGWFYENFDGKKLIIFQPHRYTRTKRFAKEFADILSARVSADCDVVLFPVYPASEPLDPEGTSEKIIKLASAPIALSDPDDFERLVEAKIKNCGGCKLSVAIVGAGDFYFRAKKFFNDRYGKEI